MGKFIAAILIFTITVLFIVYAPRLLTGLGSQKSGLFNPFNFNPFPGSSSSNSKPSSYYYTPPKKSSLPTYTSPSYSSPTKTFNNSPQPQTYLVDPPGPTFSTDQTSLTIKFSGTDPKNKKVYFETKLVGQDQGWLFTSNSYQTIYLQEGGKTYDFLVRARTEDGRYDATPAELKIISLLSPDYNKIRLNSIATGGFIPYFSISNSSQQPIDVTGIRLQGTVGSAVIPQGVRDYNTSPIQFPSDIILNPNEQVIVSSGLGPSNVNFLENECTGYLQTQNPSTYPPLNRTCPMPDYSEYSHLSPGCIDYIRTLGSCQTPNLPNVLYSDPYCSNYVYSTFNFNACYQKYRANQYFFSQTWRVFFTSLPSMFRLGHDSLVLYDQQNRVIDRYSY